MLLSKTPAAAHGSQFQKVHAEFGGVRDVKFDFDLQLFHDEHGFYFESRPMSTG